MRTITIPEKIIPQHTVNIYKFNELPEESKEQLLKKHKEKFTDTDTIGKKNFIIPSKPPATFSA